MRGSPRSGPIRIIRRLLAVLGLVAANGACGTDEAPETTEIAPAETVPAGSILFVDGTAEEGATAVVIEALAPLLEASRSPAYEFSYRIVSAHQPVARTATVHMSAEDSDALPNSVLLGVDVSSEGIAAYTSETLPLGFSSAVVVGADFGSVISTLRTQPLPPTATSEPATTLAAEPATTFAATRPCEPIPTDPIAELLGGAAATTLIVSEAGAHGVRCEWSNGSATVRFSAGVPRINTPMSVLTYECGWYAIQWVDSVSCVVEAPAGEGRPASTTYLGSVVCPGVFSQLKCTYGDMIVRLTVTDGGSGMASVTSVVDLASRIGLRA